MNIYFAVNEDMYLPIRDAIGWVHSNVRNNVDHLLWASIEQYARDMRVSINNDITAQMALPHEEHQL